MFTQTISDHPWLLIPIITALTSFITLVLWVIIKKGKGWLTALANIPLPNWVGNLIMQLYNAFEEINGDKEGCMWFILFWLVGAMPPDK